MRLLANRITKNWFTFFPRLDALHVLDATARFDAMWRGRDTLWTPSKFNVQIDASAPFDRGHATHNLLIDAQASNGGYTVGWL